MRHVKTFENFLNEAYMPGDEESIFYSIIRAIADGNLKPNGSDLEDAIDSGSLDSISHLDIEEIEKGVKKIFGGWPGVSNFALGPNPEDIPDADEAQSEVEDLIKSGFKFVGSVNMDGYEAIVLGKRKGGAGKLQVATPLMSAADYVENYYNM